MGRRRAGAVLVLLTLLGAGCAGFGAAGEPAGTVTPAPVPERAETVAPGVTAERVVDPDRLVGAHDRLLATSDHRFERRVAVSGANGTFRTREVRRVRADGTALARLRVSVGGPATSPVRNWTRWRADGRIWSRTTTAAGVRFVNPMAATGSGPLQKGRGLPEQVLTGGRFGVTPRPDGTVLVEGTRLPVTRDVSVTYVATGPPRNVSARAVVTDAGLIRNLTVTYAARVDGRTARIRIVQTTRLGPVRVERPAWVPEGDATPTGARPE